MEYPPPQRAGKRARAEFLSIGSHHRRIRNPNDTPIFPQIGERPGIPLQENQLSFKGPLLSKVRPGLSKDQPPRTHTQLHSRPFQPRLQFVSRNSKSTKPTLAPRTRAPQDFGQHAPKDSPKNLAVLTLGLCPLRLQY